MTPADWTHLNQNGRSARQWAADLAADLEGRWRAGVPVLAEAYLERVPDLHRAVLSPANTDQKTAATALTALVEREHQGRRWLGESVCPGATAPRFRACPLPAAYEPTPPPPQQAWFGPFDRIAWLDAGGMGEAVLCWNRVTERAVVVKVIKAVRMKQLEDRGHDLDPWFEKERLALVGIEHPAVMGLYGVGRYHTNEVTAGDRELTRLYGDHPYLELAWVPGPGLRGYAAGPHPRLAGPTFAGPPPDRMPPERAAAVVRRLADALAHCHARRVLHRDIKPNNVRFDRYGEPVLMDFGLAKVDLPLDAPTVMGTTYQDIGTEGFKAPELARLGPSARTDVYALGMTLYELLTGLNRDIDQPLPDPLYALDNEFRPLADICDRALDRDPAKRIGHMRQLADDLTGWLHTFHQVPQPRVVYRDVPRRVISRRAVLYGASGAAVVGAVGGWVGRPAAARREFVSPAATLLAADEYLVTRSPVDWPSLRFLTLAPLANHPAVTDAELERTAAAVEKAAGGRAVTRLPAVGRTLLVIDLMAAGLKPAEWATGYPYLVTPAERDPPRSAVGLAARRLADRTGDDAHTVRADWWLDTERYRQPVDLASAAAEVGLADTAPLRGLADATPGLGGPDGLLTAGRISRDRWAGVGRTDGGESPFRAVVLALGLGRPAQW